MSEDAPPTTVDLAVMLARIEGSVNLALANQARHEADIKELEREQGNHSRDLAGMQSDMAVLKSRVAAVETVQQQAVPPRTTGWAIVGYVTPLVALLLVVAERLYSK